jgi:hypothetical protein
MKRLLSLLLVIAMLFGVCAMFTACSDTGSSQDDDEKKEEEEEVEPTLVFKGLKIVLPEEYELEDKNEYGENSGYVRFANDDYMVDIQCGPMEYELEGMDAEEYRDYYLDMMDPESDEVGEYDVGKKNGTPYLYAIKSDNTAVAVIAFYVDGDYGWMVSILFEGDAEDCNINKLVKMITGWKCEEPDPEVPGPAGPGEEYPDGPYPVETEPTEDTQIGTVPTEPAVEAEGQLLYSGSGISVFLTDYIDGPDSKTFDFAVQNENDTAVIFYSDRFTINGSASLDGYFAFFVEAGSVATGSLTFSSEELALYGIDIIGNLSFPFNIEDANNYCYLAQGDMIYVETDYAGYQHYINSYGEVIFDQNGVRIILQQIDLMNDYFCSATLYVENSTYDSLTLDLADLSINGWTISHNRTQAVVESETYCMIRLDINAAKTIGISTIENLYMNVDVYHSWGGSYDYLYSGQAVYTPGDPYYTHALNHDIHWIYSSGDFELGWFDYYETDDYLIFRMCATNYTQESIVIQLDNPIVNGSSRHEGFAAPIPANSRAIYELYVPFVNHIGFTGYNTLDSLEYQLSLVLEESYENLVYEQVSFPLN